LKGIGINSGIHENEEVLEQ